MRKLAFTLIALFAMGSAAVAQEAAELAEKMEVTEDQPTFKFLTESHDFSTVKEGDQAIHEFVFYNIGKDPLILTNVSASCGCTTPIWPKEPIKAGEKGVIKAVYNSKGRPGPFSKSITVTSNAQPSVKVLKIRGTVERAKPGTPVNEEASPVIQN